MNTNLPSQAKNKKISTIGTKCNSLTQQFIGISTTIDIWATCFDSYRVIFRPSKNTDPILQGKTGSVFFEGLKMTR